MRCRLQRIFCIFSVQGVSKCGIMVKQNNRRCELALREMEIWSVLAMNKGMDYNLAKADALWKELLLHQFHDILPGSSIAKVYVEAENAFHEILDGADELQKDALNALTDQKEDQAVTVFNSLSFPRKMLVELPAVFANGAKTVDGTAVQVQKIGDTYYWLGEDRTNGYRPMPGVHLYSSKDLYNWKDEGVVLRTMDNYEQFETDDYFKNLYGDLTEAEKKDIYVDLWAEGCVMERPKMLYNEKTRL